ncbi:endonuclease G, mitochondrial-like [Centruroides sculpturatus]|uniref:endonuclease G, mitochondrial-like n=1 Tax=Centruroides sculpturatus TaxID=218467 RepID=UPI000C6EA1FB|nr:endonuclease G, mitochondrial-like [Centruroides sculpturatus]
MKSKVVGLCISSAVGWSLGIQFEKWRTSTVRAKTLIEDQADSAPILPPNRIGQIARYGFPGTGNVRALDDFLLSYDFRNRIAYWTLEHLTYDRLHPNYKVDRSKCEFVQDESIHALFRSTNDDFKRSGYDRGHLAAAGNHRMSQKHVEQTFFLSNIAPQVSY